MKYLTLHMRLWVILMNFIQSKPPHIQLLLADIVNFGGECPVISCNHCPLGSGSNDGCCAHLVTEIYNRISDENRKTRIALAACAMRRLGWTK